MVDVVGSKTYRGCMQRAAVAGGAGRLACIRIADPETQVCSELRRVRAP